MKELLKRNSRSAVNRGAVQSSKNSASGFSLIELLIVLAVIGAIAAAVLPNIGLTVGSQMALSMRDFSTQVRTLFDSAILTGRVHRLVIDPKEGTYWSEAAPLGFKGRPPLAQAPGEGSAREEDRAKLLEDLGTAVAEPRPAGESGTRYYSFRSILVNQRNVLNPVKWNEINDSLLFRRTLSGSVVFAAIATELMEEKKSRAEFEGTEKAFIYFFPDGLVTQSAIQFGVEGEDGGVSEEGPKFTIFVDPLTGRSQILEGFQDAEFIKD